MSFSFSPIIITPSMATLESTMRMAFTAAVGSFLSIRPIHREAAMAAASKHGRVHGQVSDGACDAGVTGHEATSCGRNRGKAKVQRNHDEG